MMPGGSEPCDLLQVETELDLIEGELAVELPGHMRAFVRAHADGRSPPAAPSLLRRSSTLRTARNALAHDLLFDRGLALLRLCVPILIEADRAVSLARADTPSWPGLERLTIARDDVARRLFGIGAVELMHHLHGSHGHVPAQPLPPTLPPPVEGWRTPDTAVDTPALADLWQLVSARLGASGAVRFDRAARTSTVPPRSFIVEPQREVIVVVGHSVDTPAARFAVLHELGHVFLGLTLPAGAPRVVDEAAASYIARYAEPPTWLPPRWTSPLATAARARRRALAMSLDDIERRLPHLASPPSFAPPWALWHDPGAQAAYVAAEDMADRVSAELGPNPPRGQVLRAFTAERDRIDQRTAL